MFIERRHIHSIFSPRGFLIGHMLICPIRQVTKFTELSELESLNLFVSVKLEMKGLE